MPSDLEETELAEYKNLAPRRHDWPVVQAAAARLALVIFDQVCALQSPQG
jgi:hypothetical protein